MKTLETMQKTAEANAFLSFEEYAAIKEPAVNIIVNDYATKMVEEAKKKGEELTMEKARELARKEIPSAFVPEWMKNLRISANVAGTELCYLEGIRGQLETLTELLHIIADDKIDAYIKRHSGDFKAVGGGVKNE